MELNVKLKKSIYRIAKEAIESKKVPNGNLLSIEDILDIMDLPENTLEELKRAFFEKEPIHIGIEYQ